MSAKLVFPLSHVNDSIVVYIIGYSIHNRVTESRSQGVTESRSHGEGEILFVRYLSAVFFAFSHASGPRYICIYIYIYIL